MSGRSTMQIIGCPECDATAEVADQGTAAGSSGSVGVARVVCVNRHWFLMAHDSLRPAHAPSATGA